jgi:hypothetical protein
MGLITLFYRRSIKHHDMKTHGRIEAEIRAFVTSVLEGDESSASRNGRFIPGERSHDTHSTGWWVGLKATKKSLALMGIEL